MEAPQITTTEIQDWEAKFREQVSPLVKFDAEQGQASMKLYNGQSGIEATWTGTIILQADNYIKWTFSLQNEPFVEAKMNLGEDTKMLMENLYNFYTTWKQEWGSSIGGGQAPDAEKATAVGGAPGASAKTEAPADDMEMPIDNQIKENKRTKDNILAEHGDRMKRLAGLL